MSVFVVCTQCNHLELVTHAKITPGAVLCTLCNPAIKEWHGIIARTQYDPVKHKSVMGSDGYSLG